MTSFPETGSELCNCLAVRQAARRISQFYGAFLAPSGLKATQFSILARLGRRGPLSVNELAEAMVMDRTTLGRNLRPLERDGLVRVATGEDRRRRDASLTADGRRRLEAALPLWKAAQKSFEASYGHERAARLRRLTRAVAEIGDPAPTKS
jgi:DNA-binding MarR family transcriptional regulator